MNTIEKINAEQFRARQKDPRYCVIDVRDRAEFASGSEASVCWPVNEINDETVRGFVRDHHLGPEKNIVLLCARGMRASQAADKLRALIPNPIAVVEGGMAALAPAGRQPVSIERQVRIAAGGLVLLGIVGSVLVHPTLIAISAFVACGLIFAGVTDWCGLGLLMMKMPWNHTK
jgi:rhodanese-related sulfurtransferase